MNLEELAAAGAFVAREPVEREIKWTMDSKDYTAKVFIKQMSIGEQERVVARFDRKGGALRYNAATISALVGFGEGGKEQMTVDQADQLRIPLADALMAAIAEVNGQLLKN